MHRIRTVRKLLFNALRYRLLKYSGRPHPLEAISLEVTHRCICRCQMCNIWQIPKSLPDLPLSDWINLLSSPGLHRLRELDITGGEPFLREDLAELIKWICLSKPDYFPRLKTLAITTNGLLTDRILDVTRIVAGTLQQQGVDLVLACGMDAVGERHDQIRQHKGAWQKLLTTIDGLKGLRASFPNLILGIKTTIVPLNAHQLDRIADFARQHGLFTIVSPCIITSNRFGNVDLKETLKLGPEDLQAIKRFYAGPSFAWSGHREAMLRYLETGTMKKPCSAGFNTVFVRHTGEVFPCPVIAKTLGNIKDLSINEILSNPTAEQFRKQIGTFPECKVCTEPGLERIAWPFEGFTCLRCFLHKGPRDFACLAQHMGFDKYL
jgi:MoaA/NifB/PqqE/SkfB family radical SAM enzyme